MMGDHATEARERAAMIDGQQQMAADSLPWLTTDQMVEIDRIMIEDLRIELKQMMENAGRNLASLAQQLVNPARVVVVVGSGGNGGGGLVAARHLANHGCEVHVVVTRPAADFSGVPSHQLDILTRMGVPVTNLNPAPVNNADVILDALIGYSLRGAARGPALELINAVNRVDVPIISLDVPSGVDSSTGEASGAAIRADATLTLAAPKVGLRDNPLVGRLFVGDISVPPSAYMQLGVPEMPAFRTGWIAEIVDTVATGDPAGPPAG